MPDVRKDSPDEENVDAKHPQDIIQEIEVLEKEKPWKGPLKIILALFIMMIIVLMIVPLYSIKLDPEPSVAQIPQLDEIQRMVTDVNVSQEITNDYLSLITPNNPDIKLISDTIISSACKESSDVCYAKALFLFVRDRMNYISDPNAYEYIKPPLLTIKSGGGDCDDASVLLANLLESIGIKTRFVFVPHHVFVQAKIGGALKKYKFQEDWVNLDATCSDCGFGEITYSVSKQEMRYQ